jgi:hypothetical protein
MDFVETSINGIRKVKMTREFAIDSILSQWKDLYDDDPTEAIQRLLEIQRKGIRGLDQMTNIELVQELEGSVFYGEIVDEITIVSAKGE